MGFPMFVYGRGMVDSEEVAVDKAVFEYDERLYFQRNPDTGQYCVYLKTPASEPDIPLFGWDRIPHPEDAVKKLWNNDSLRHGEEILRRIDAHNESIDRAMDERTSDASGQMAEGLEWAMRRMGSHPTPRIFVPKDI